MHKLKMIPIIPLLLFSVNSFAGGSAACDNMDHIYSVKGTITYSDQLKTFVGNGGDPSSILYIDSINSILDNFDEKMLPKNFEYNEETRYEYGYKFGLSALCELNVSKFRYKERNIPDKNVHHHLVAKGDTAYSAGAILFFHSDHKIEKIVLVNRSSRFCPSLESQDIVKNYLVLAGIPAEKIEIIEGQRKSCK